MTDCTAAGCPCQPATLAVTESDPVFDALKWLGIGLSGIALANITILLYLLFR